MEIRGLPVKPNEGYTEGNRRPDKDWPKADGLLLRSKD
jgi:hypothetical protein